MSAELKKRVLVIGLDGMTYDVLKPLAEAGIMPNCKKLMDAGTWGTLTSTVPPVTGPAWVSFATGKQPGNHGVFDFFKPTKGRNAVGMSRRIINSREVDGKTLWQLLTDAGKKSIVMNVPVSYPATPINGVLLADMLSPDTGEGFSAPPRIVQKYESELGPYTITVNWQQFSEARAVDFLDAVIECERQRTKYCLRMMDEHADWDLCFPCYTETDRVMHALWHYLDPAEREKAKAQGRYDQRVMDKVHEFYRAMDNIIGELTAKAGPDTAVFFVSDHGFGPLYGKVMVNQFLADRGLLVVNQVKIKAALAKILLRKVWFKFLKTIGLNSIVQRQTAKARADRGSDTSRTFYDVFYESIDWTKTKAYMASNTEGGLYLNVKGRRLYDAQVDRGCIDPKDYERVRLEVIEALKDIRHPETGKSMLSHVMVREEVYTGKYVERAPDIVFFLDDGEWIADFSLGKGLYKHADWKTGSGMHRMEGCFLACGPGIAHREHITTDIFNVVPTILAHMGLAIPTDMDGRFIEEAYTTQWKAANEVTYAGSSAQDGKGWGAGAQVFDESEEQVLVDRLRGLGYVD